MGIEHDTSASAAPAPAPAAPSGSGDNSKPAQSIQSAPDGSALPNEGGNETRGDRKPKNGRFENKRGRGRGGRGGGRGGGGGGGGGGGRDNKDKGESKRRDLGRHADG
ncbi:hypothetical protein PG996_006008 [Apiospora saccharicola]|uniref:Uncharacterized protein n=1 Tax=Apiospora saccharicola TaxID=335842 RepID=A0ABR1VN47_9PEZI